MGNNRCLRETTKKLLGRLNIYHIGSKGKKYSEEKKWKVIHLAVPYIALFICKERMRNSTRLLGSEKSFSI